MLETKAKDSKKIRGQGPTFRGQTLSRPRTGMLEAKVKDREHNFLNYGRQFVLIVVDKFFIIF